MYLDLRIYTPPMEPKTVSSLGAKKSFLGGSRLFSACEKAWDTAFFVALC